MGILGGHGGNLGTGGGHGGHIDQDIGGGHGVHIVQDTGDGLGGHIGPPDIGHGSLGNPYDHKAGGQTDMKTRRSAESFHGGFPVDSNRSDTEFLLDSGPLLGVVRVA